MDLKIKIIMFKNIKLTLINISLSDFTSTSIKKKNIFMFLVAVSSFFNLPVAITTPNLN